MGADLQIHIFTDEFTERHYKAFNSNTMGSNYFSPGADKFFEKVNKCSLYELCSDTPSIWIGEVSWLKAMIMDDSEEFIPHAVMKVSELIGEDFPVIDDILIDKVGEAMELGNQVDFYSIAKKDEVLKFLENHRGKKAFTVSW